MSEIMSKEVMDNFIKAVKSDEHICIPLCIPKIPEFKIIDVGNTKTKEQIMSEQKVWVEKMPESCSKCEWCTLNHKDNYGRPFCSMARMPLYNGDKIKEERGQHKGSLSDFDCPLQSIKDHDRELVRQICEKIKEKLGFIINGQERIICDGSMTGDKTILAVLNQIQKEAEDVED